ncbi:MAG: UDP-glucose 4-epimerase GalE [Cyclobacteriaceae bacterium]
MKKVLLTGGLGYIGSHVAVELIQQGYDIVIIDDLSNSEYSVLERLSELTGTEIYFESGDLRDDTFLSGVFQRYKIDSVIHLAAKKAVGESVHKPLHYYDVNVSGLVNLLKVLEDHPVKKFIFSSSCTVYGQPKLLPVTESTPFGDTPSPYGKTKQMCEHILESVAKVAKYQVVSLRYFNPVGAHHSGKIGELPKGVPNNLVPFITQAGARLRDELKVYGGDYDTADGTAIRDYIHVVDLAKAHVKALKLDMGAHIALNLGTGQGYSVLEVIQAFEEVADLKLNYLIVDRRAGDLPEIYGDPSLAYKKLRWKAELGLTDMMRDAWRWQQSLVQ